MLLTLLDKLDDERSHAAEEREIASVTAMAYAGKSPRDVNLFIADHKLIIAGSDTVRCYILMRGWDSF